MPGGQSAGCLNEFQQVLREVIQGAKPQIFTRMILTC